MTEDEAKASLRERGVSRETFDHLSSFIDLVAAENTRQNLIAASTLEAIWPRHVLDSAQLLDLAPRSPSIWLDLGSGPGFPGLIVAALSRHHVILIESRARRVEFLHAAAECLQVTDRVEIVGSRVETVPSRVVDMISARAFAPLPRLLDLAGRFASPETLWLLPKGRSAAEELAAAAGSWQGGARLVPSITDSEASIIVARGQVVRKR